MIADPTAITQPLDDLWAEDGRIFVIGTGNMDYTNLDYVHDPDETILGHYLNTPIQDEMADHVLNRLDGRIGYESGETNDQFTDPDRLFVLQTQLTFDNTTILYGIIASMIAAADLQDILDVGYGDFVAWVADEALGLPDCCEDGSRRVTSLKFAPAATPNTTLVNDTFNVGFWDESADFGVAPIFDLIDQEPGLLANLNVVSVDQYHLITGFVEAMIALASDRTPRLNVVDVADFDFSEFDNIAPVYFNQLPAGHRGTLQSYDHADYDFNSAWNAMTEFDVEDEDSLDERRLIGLDIAAIPGSTRSVVVWGELNGGESNCADEPDGQVALTVVSQGSSGDLVEVGPMRFRDAVGAPSVAIHGGRVYVAYPYLTNPDDNNPLANADPVLRMWSAAIPSDWSTLTRMDFESMEVSDVKLPFRQIGDFSCCGVPRAELMSSDGRLLVAWNGPATEQLQMRNCEEDGGLGGPSLEGNPLHDVGSIKWAEIPLDGGTPTINTIIEGDCQFPILAQVQGTPLGDTAVIGFGTGNPNLDPLFYLLEPEPTEIPISFNFCDEKTLALGQWENELLVACSGEANTYDEVTGDATATARQISWASESMLAFAQEIVNDPPVCDTGGPYVEECNGPMPTVGLINASTDLNGDALLSDWSTACTDASISSSSAASPDFMLDYLGACSAECDVFLTVDDGLAQDSCSTTVTIQDTTPPTIDSEASDSTVECDGSGNVSELQSWLNSNAGGASSDVCDPQVNWSNDFSGLSNGCGMTGSAQVTFTATDDCGLTAETVATFTIEDTVGPTFDACPAGPIYHQSPAGSCSDSVSYSVIASDVCDTVSVSCVADNSGASGVGPTGGTFPVGTSTVTCTATDACGLSNQCVFDVVVNDPPQITSVTPATQGVQYSDLIVPVEVTATDCGPGTDLTLEFDSADIPNALALSSTADSCATNASDVIECTWTLDNNDRVLEPQGSYVIDNIKAVDPTPLNGTTLKSSPGETITINVAAEDATIAFLDANPVAVEVASEGGNSGVFTLSVDIRELLPEVPTSGGELPGDIGEAVLSMTFVPVGPGSPAVGTCTPDNDPAAFDYSAELMVTCSFDNVPVNTYGVDATPVARQLAGGGSELYYSGSNEDVLVIFDPSLGFTTGGGWFYWPGTSDKTNVGYTMKYNKKRTNLQGSLMLIRHVAGAPDAENKWRIKSNMLDGLALGSESEFDWASFTGKTTYLAPGMETEGNYEFTVYVEDHGSASDGLDRFWLQVRDKQDDVVPDLSMDKPATDEAVLLEGGNIVVPHQ